VNTAWGSGGGGGGYLDSGAVTVTTAVPSNTGNGYVTIRWAALAVQDHVPTMTGDTAPSGTVTYSSLYSALYAGWAAFSDVNPPSGGQATWHAATTGSGQWLAYEFTAPKVVNRWTVRTGTPGTHTLGLEAWNGSAWVRLDTRTLTDAGGFSSAPLYGPEFLFSNSTAYSKYRVYWDAVGGDNYARLYEVEFGQFGTGSLCDAARLSCAEHKAAGCATSGVYTINPGGASMTAYCDMTTDTGGWTLVLNYNHLGGTSPSHDIRTASLPLLGSESLGINESGTPVWGHAANSLMGQISFTESRWYCKTGGHARVAHFKTSYAPCNDHIKTGAGACGTHGSSSGLALNFTALAGHTASLPGSAIYFGSNLGNTAMTDFPWYDGGPRHWGIHLPLSRWECDDYPNGPGNNTFHQVWVR
jgi:hypothetical protein